MTGRTGRTDHCDRSDRLGGTGLIGLGSRSERSLPVLAKLHILVKISSEIEPIGDIELLGGTCDMCGTSSFVQLMLAEPEMLIIGFVYVGVTV